MNFTPKNKPANDGMYAIEWIEGDDGLMYSSDGIWKYDSALNLYTHVVNTTGDFHRYKDILNINQAISADVEEAIA